MLTQLKDGQCKDNKNIPIVVMTVRNEILRLPFILSYYRGLGITCFLIVDNVSTDGTVEFLLRQPDVKLFSTSSSYAAAKFGLDWQMELLDRFCMNSWALVVDADEIFVYAHAEELKIADFCAALRREGTDGLFCTMIDMYADGPISNVAYKQGESLFEACPFFDNSYVFRSRLRNPFVKQLHPKMDVGGGVRERLFYPAHAGSLWYRTSSRVLRMARKIVSKTGITVSFGYGVPPFIFKIPLVYWTDKLRFTSAHTISGQMKLSRRRGALLHFKYLEDFHIRVEQALSSGMHFDNGTEYKMYADALSKNKEINFFCGVSTRYKNSDTLLELGIIS